MQTYDRFLRQSEIIRRGKRAKPDPDYKPLLPIGNSAWWEGIRRGTYPAPIKLGPGTTVWRESEIRRLIETGDWRPPTKDRVDATDRAEAVA